MMLKRLLLSFCFIFVMMVGCTQKEEHDGDTTVHHNYYDNTTNSSRISEVEHTYKTDVECWIVSNAGTLVECSSMQ